MIDQAPRTPVAHWRPSLEELVARARRLAGSDGRHILGITGPPGAGKSTLAEALTEALGDAARYLPMDGFHLAGAELRRLGREDRKGAPDTFDAAGYVALLRRLREGSGDVVYAPAFERRIEEPIAGAIPIPPEVHLVVTEGNYLLLDAGPWSAVRALLDQAWYVDMEPGIRVARLIDRHVRFGRSRPDAEAWVRRSDEANAALVGTTIDRADLVVREAASTPS